MQPYLSQSAHHTSPATEMGLGEISIWSIRIRLSEKIQEKDSVAILQSGEGMEATQ